MRDERARPGFITPWDAIYTFVPSGSSLPASLESNKVDGISKVAAASSVGAAEAYSFGD